MKKTKLLIGFLCIVLILVCCSCGLFAPQRYVCDVSQVEMVQIVKLNDYVEEEYKFEYTVLSEITDYTSFVAELNDVNHSVNWGDPMVLNEGDVVVKIDYLNGDFDLLRASAQMWNQSGTNYYGYFFFDEDQFNALISKYSEE